MKRLTFLLLFCSTLLFSQKEISHTIGVNEQLKTVYFTLNSVFNISLHTSTKKEIIITAHSEGEYANYFAINETRSTTTLNIDGNVDFIFPNYQDKLSAHKVHAIAVDIWVPENLQIIIQSDIGTIVASGTYQSLLIDSQSGSCFLQNIKGYITASTSSGSIVLKTNEGVVKTQTNTGVVKVSDIAKGQSRYALKTNNGNITVKKI